MHARARALADCQGETALSEHAVKAAVDRRFRTTDCAVDAQLQRPNAIDTIRVMFGVVLRADKSVQGADLAGDAHPLDIATILDSEGVAIRAGDDCGQLVMKHFGVAATTRASFSLYNTTDDVDRLVHGLEVVQGIFGR